MLAGLLLRWRGPDMVGLARTLYDGFAVGERRALDADALALTDGLRLGNWVVGPSGKLEAPRTVMRRVVAAADRLDRDAPTTLAARARETARALADGHGRPRVPFAGTRLAMRERMAEASRRLAALDEAAAGTLGLHTIGDRRSLGHSWISFQAPGRAHETYGTWGAVPGSPAGRGLFQDLERRLHLQPQASTSVQLDAAAVQRLRTLLLAYDGLGKQGWSPLRNCSTFARDAWLAATGVDLGGHPTTPVSLRRRVAALVAGR